MQTFPMPKLRLTVGAQVLTATLYDMAIHVNHLNAMVKEMTGKSTGTHINERLLREARLLLAHTDWSVGEIAYSLGFEYPTYFNNFFKKHTGTTPLTFRRAQVPGITTEGTTASCRQTPVASD